MPRRKPFSTKQKKAHLQDKRAVKRGDLDAQDVRIASHTHRAARPGAGGGRHPPAGQNGLTSTRLTSRFVALSPAYLDKTRDEAYNLILPRPIPRENGVFPVEIMHRDAGVVQGNRGQEDRSGSAAAGQSRAGQRLSCPSRPKFRYDMTKKEVEKNEEGYYARWLDETEGVVRAWVEGEEETKQDGAEQEVDGNEIAAFKVGGGLTRRSPTWFETNLEVWRQL